MINQKCLINHSPENIYLFFSSVEETMSLLFFFFFSDRKKFVVCFAHLSLLLFADFLWWNIGITEMEFYIIIVIFIRTHWLGSYRCGLRGCCGMLFWKAELLTAAVTQHVIRILFARG